MKLFPFEGLGPTYSLCYPPLFQQGKLKQSCRRKLFSYHQISALLCNATSEIRSISLSFYHFTRSTCVFYPPTYFSFQPIYFPVSFSPELRWMCLFALLFFFLTVSMSPYSGLHSPTAPFAGNRMGSTLHSSSQPPYYLYTS